MGRQKCRRNCIVLLLFIVILVSESTSAQGKHTNNGESKFEISLQLRSPFVGDNISAQIGYSYRGKIDVGYGVNAVRWSSKYEHNDVTNTVLINFHPIINKLSPVRLSFLTHYIFDPVTDIVTIEPLLHLDNKIRKDTYINFHFGIGFINHIEYSNLKKSYRNIGFSLVSIKNDRSNGFIEFSFVTYYSVTTLINKFGFYF